MTNLSVSEIKKKNLKRIMAERGLKNVDLARLMNVTKPTITNLLKDIDKNGSRNIGQDTIDKICNVLNIDEKEFYRGLFDEQESNNNGKVIYLQAINGTRIEDPDRSLMHRRLDMILDYSDNDLKEAIKSNLVSFSKTIEAFKKIEAQDEVIKDALDRIRALEAKGG